MQVILYYIPFHLTRRKATQLNVFQNKSVSALKKIERIKESFPQIFDSCFFFFWAKIPHGIEAVEKEINRIFNKSMRTCFYTTLEVVVAFA